MQSIVYLPIEKVIVKENHFEDLSPDIFDKLVASVKEHGILEPLHICKENGFYVVKQGHQRHRVARELGIKELPCIVIENPNKAIGAEFDINLYRRHLMPDQIQHMEIVKHKVKQEKKIGLIPELAYLKEVLPPDILATVEILPEHAQRTVYKSLPEKIVENPELAKQYDERAKIAEEELKKERAKADMLAKQIERYKKIASEYETLKTAKHDTMQNALALEKTKLEEELREKYSEEGEETLSQRIEEEKAKLEEFYGNKYEKDVEEFRRIAEINSKARNDLENQISPLKDKVRQLETDCDMYRESAAAAKNAASNMGKRIEELLHLQDIPGQILNIAKEFKIARKKLIALKENLIKLSDTIHHTRKDNLEAIKALEAELKNVTILSQDVTSIIK